MPWAPPETEEWTPPEAAPAWEPPEANHEEKVKALMPMGAAGITQHVAQNPQDEAQAWDAYQRLHNRPVTDKIVDTIKDIPSMVKSGVEGVAQFATGIPKAIYHSGVGALQNVDARIDTALGKDAMAEEMAKRATTNKAESVLAEQQNEESLRHLGRAVVNTAKWATGHEDLRSKYEQEVEAAKRAQQIQSGRPLDTGVVAAIQRGVEGAIPSELFSPEKLAEMGAQPVNPETVQGVAAGGDPMNAVMMAAGTFPGASQAAGAGLKAAGTVGEAAAGGAANLIKKAASSRLAHRLTPIGLATEIATGGAHLPAAAATAAVGGATWMGAKLAQAGFGLAKEAGNELLGAYPLANQSLFRTVAKEGIKGAASTAVGMAPFNIAESQGDLHDLVNSGVSAGVFGLVMGAVHGGIGSRAIAARGNFGQAVKAGASYKFNDAQDQAHDAVMAQLPKASQDLINFTRGTFAGATTPDGKPIRVTAMDRDGFIKATGQASRGVWFGEDGQLIVNVGEIGPDGKLKPKSPVQIAETLAHEGKHALDQANRAAQPDLYKSVFDSLRKSFTTDGKTPTHEFQAWIAQQTQLHVQNLQKAGASPEQVNAQMQHLADPEYWLNEASADIGQGLVTGSDLGKFMLPQSMAGKVWDAVKAAAARNGVIIPQKAAGGALGLPEAQQAVSAIRQQLYQQGRETSQRLTEGVQPKKQPLDTPEPVSAPIPPPPATPADAVPAPAPIPAPAPTLNRYRIAAILRRNGLGKDEATQWAQSATGATDEDAVVDALKRRAENKFGIKPSSPAATEAPPTTAPAQKAPIAGEPPSVETTAPPEASPTTTEVTPPPGELSTSQKTKIPGIHEETQPEPARTATGVQEPPSPVSPPARTQEAETFVPTEAIEHALNHAELTTLSSDAYARKRAGKKTTKEQGQAVMVKEARIQALYDLLPAEGDTLHRVTDPDTGELSYQGEIDPENPVHRAILKEQGLGDQAVRNILEGQNRKGQGVILRDYNSAEQENIGGQTDQSAEQRGVEYQKSRTGAEKGTRQGEVTKQDKHVTILGVKGTKNGVNLVTFDHDKFLDNVRKILTAVKEAGINTIADRLNPQQLADAIKTAFQNIAENNINGWKSRGNEPQASFPDAPVQPTPGYQGKPVDRFLANLINMALHNKAAVPGEKPNGNTELAARKFAKKNAVAKQVAGLAEINNRPLAEDGESNYLRAVLKRAGFDGDKQIKDVTSNIRPDLIEGGIADEPGSGMNIHEHGFEIPASELTEKGRPQPLPVAGNFLPETISQEPPPVLTKKQEYAENAQRRIALRQAGGPAQPDKGPLEARQTAGGSQPQEVRADDGHGVRKTQFKHYSQTEGIERLDPAFHGSGITGEEAQRKRDYPELYEPRIYIGLRGYKKEGSLGPQEYKGSVDENLLYDSREDPLNLWEKADIAKRTAGYAKFDERAEMSMFEKLVKQHGFLGYKNTAAKVGAVFHPIDSAGHTDFSGFSKTAPELARRSPEMYSVLRDFTPNIDRIDPKYFAQQPIDQKQAKKQNAIANDYAGLKDNNLADPKVKKAYAALVTKLGEQAKAMEAAGIKVEPWDKPGQPYANSRELQADLRQNKHLWYFKTGENQMPGDHPLAKASDLKPQNGYQPLWNDVLRWVHDGIAHGAFGVQFGPKGEEAAWRSHMATIDDPWARWALTTETRGQNSKVNFSNDMMGKNGLPLEPGEKGYIPPQDRPFADQKTDLLDTKYMLTGDKTVDEVVSKNKAFQRQSSYMPETAELFPPAEVAGVSEKNFKNMALARKAWREQGTESPFFKRWFGESAVKDENGAPKKVVHGTTKTFWFFDSKKSTPYADVGPGFYFSDNTRDSEWNYAGEHSPDLQQRVMSLADKYEREGDMSYAAARKRAQRELVGNSPKVLEMYLKMDKPLIVQPDGGTKFDMEMGLPKGWTITDTKDGSETPYHLRNASGKLLDVAGEEYELHDSYGQESGTALDLRDAVKAVADEKGLDGDKLWEDIAEPHPDAYMGRATGKKRNLMEDGSITAEQVIGAIKYSAALDELDFEERNTVIPEIFKKAGFDGVELRNADKRYNLQMPPNTTHYVVWEPTQIKSAERNKGTFDPQDKRFNFQPEKDKENIFAKNEEAKFDPNKLATEAEQAGVNLKTDDLKNLMREEPGTLDRVRRRIKENTGEDAKYMPEGYDIQVDDPEDARHVTAYKDGKEIGSLITGHATQDRWLGVRRAQVDLEHRNKGIATAMYKALVSHLGDNFDGISSRLSERTNDREIPKIYERLGGNSDGDYAYIPKPVARFMPDNEANEHAKPFYSQLPRTVAAIPQDRMTIEQAVSFLKKGTKSEPAVKGAELNLSGILTDPLSPLVGKQTGEKVTKQELLSYAIERQTRVEETVLEAPKSMKTEDIWNKKNRIKELQAKTQGQPREVAGPIFEEIDRLSKELRNEDKRQYADNAALNTPGALPDSPREMFITWPEKYGTGTPQSLAGNWQDGHSPYADIVNPVARVRSALFKDSEGGLMLLIDEIQGPNPENQKKMPPEVRDNIYQIGMKRALRQAIELGATKLAWTTGDSQADRYDLSKHVGKITWEFNNHSNTYSLDIFDKEVGHNISEHVPDRIKPDELEKYIGKEIAQKILDADEPSGEFTGTDLKVGGEGLKRLYDFTLPSIARKLGDKFGAVLGKTTLSGDRDASTNTEQAFTEGAVKRILDRGGEVYLTKHDIAGESLVSNAQELSKYISDNGRPDAYILGDKAGGFEVHILSIPESLRQHQLNKGNSVFMPSGNFAKNEDTGLKAKARPRIAAPVQSDDRYRKAALERISNRQAAGVN